MTGPFLNLQCVHTEGPEPDVNRVISNTVKGDRERQRKGTERGRERRRERGNGKRERVGVREVEGERERERERESSYKTWQRFLK